MQTIITIDTQKAVSQIGSILYMEGNAASPELPPAMRAQIQDATNDENRLLLDMYLDTAAANLREALLAYVTQDSGQRAAMPATADQPHPERPMRYSLNLPDGIAQTTVATLGQLMHNYVVNYVVAAWLTMTYPPKADYYHQLAMQGLLDIDAALTHRTRPIRRTMHPF